MRLIDKLYGNDNAETTIVSHFNRPVQKSLDGVLQPIFIDCLEKSSSKEEFEKAFSTDLQKKFPNGAWRTINGSHVFINGGKVVAGFGGFNKEIDKFFEGKKGESGKKDSVNLAGNKGDKYEIKEARYAKGKMALHIKSEGSWKNREARLADAVNGKYSNRERAYIVSLNQAKKFEKYVKEGYDYSPISGELEQLKETKQEGSLSKDKPFQIKFEEYSKGSGKFNEATVIYDKKNFTYNLETKDGKKTTMGEKKLQEMISNGDYKVTDKQEGNKKVNITENRFKKLDFGGNTSVISVNRPENNEYRLTMTVHNSDTKKGLNFSYDKYRKFVAITLYDGNKHESETHKELGRFNSLSQEDVDNYINEHVKQGNKKETKQSGVQEAKKENSHEIKARKFRENTGVVGHTIVGMILDNKNTDSLTSEKSPAAEARVWEKLSGDLGLFEGNRSLSDVYKNKPLGEFQNEVKRRVKEMAIDKNVASWLRGLNPNEKTKDMTTKPFKAKSNYIPQPKQKQSYHKNDGLDQFRDIAKKSKDVNDFMNKVRKVGSVSNEVGKKFRDKYDGGGKLSMEAISKKFIDEVKGGGSKTESSKSFKGYDVLKNPPMVGDKLKMTVTRGGGRSDTTKGEVYEVSSSGKSFRLKDQFGNKEERWMNIQDYKKATINRK